MATTKIEWTEASWNPITGCTKISEGCKHCYAERMAMRLQAMGNPNYINGFSLTLHSHMLELPLTWKSPRMVFVNSMSDLFHSDVPLAYIKKVFSIMAQAKQHTFQILTKRSERMAELAPQLPWTPNIWMGGSVENQASIYRIEHLRTIRASIRFLSCEPLLGSLGPLNLEKIDWIIVGGESGPGARPMQESWAIELREQCIQNKIPFFFKQWGGGNKKKAGRELQGKIWNQFPA